MIVSFPIVFYLHAIDKNYKVSTMRIVISLLVLLFSSSIASAETIRREVPANKTSTVGAHATYGPSCTGGAIPKFRVTKAPEHGQVTFKVVSFKLSDKTGRCAGRNVKGTAVIYKPNRGYRGKDVFKVGFKMDMYVSGSAKIRNVVDKYVIEVK